MIDALAVLRTYLVAQSTLTAQVPAARVYGPPGLPAGDVPSMPRTCLLYIADGGLEDSRLPGTMPRVQFRCYGATTAGAHTVYRALVDVLHGKRNAAIGSTNVLLGADMTAGPYDMIEPSTGWPFVWCAFDLVLARNGI